MPASGRSEASQSFETVRKVRRYEQVAEQIRRLIGSGALKPGDLLPPERELAEKLGVGRSSVRDAVRTLEVMGILEPRQGHGTVVRDLSA
ncbi:MAG TPA: GntR family transcriptional regulator, partial [Myxococcales bacterium]|nr:GntR family transcriptional regulator [Myxococcales bacterium]